MSLSNAATGATGYVVDAIQSTPGGSGTVLARVEPTAGLPVISNGLKAPFDMVNGKVMSGTRFSHRIKERAKIQPAGPITWYWNPALGLEYVLGALGAKSTIAAVAATATTAGITTTDGTSDITVAGTFVPGAMVHINTDNAGVETASTETRTVLPTSTAGHLKVAALNGNAAAASGIFVTQPTQDKYANSLLPTGHENELPTLTVQSNKGKQWAWEFVGSYVDDLNWAFSATDVQVTANLYATGGRPLFRNASTTPVMASYSGLVSTTDEKRALRPFTSMDVLAVVTCDADATGTSTLRLADGMNDLKIAFSNKLIKIAAFNGSESYTGVPGDDVQLMVDYSEINTAKRAAEWEELIALSQRTPLIVQTTKNYGTAIAPKTGGTSIYLPNIALETADPEEAVGKVNEIKVKGEAMAEAGFADLVQVFVLNPA